MSVNVPPASPRLALEVDIPEPYAGHDYRDDLEYLLPLLVAQLATGVSRDTIARRLNRDWPARQEYTP